MHRLLLNREIYEEVMVRHIPETREMLWVITADIKDLHIQFENDFVPFLAVLSELVSRSVAVRLMHAKEPGPRFRQDFDRFDNLIGNDLFERVLCPRIHTKAIIIDGRLAFVGSPNLTGAGLGAKHIDKRNFEAGILFDDHEQIERLLNWADDLYLGNHCHDCRRREFCPDPIIDGL